jgi:hypothetical protein
MTKPKTTDVLTSIVELLTPLDSEERQRVIGASLMLLGETSVPARTSAVAENEENLRDIPPRARAWMKQSGITSDALEQVFHIVDGEIEMIAPHVPGNNKKEQTYSAYILTGIGRLITTGAGTFSDAEARALCMRLGCYDTANHSAILKARGNEFTGSKDKGWTLTAPGTKRGAELIRELSKSEA